ncbi:MAG: 5'-nucleotidase C-terminal domain-containing protein [Pseudomonadota bacterium]
MKKLICSIFILALWIFPSLVFAQAKHLTILHFNDIHGHLDDGIKIATLIEQIKKENKTKGWQTLVLFGGDAFTGTIISREFQGKAEFDFFNALDLDAMVIGNHEFDYGQQVLQERIKQANFPLLSANIYLQDSQKLLFDPVVIIELGGVIASDQRERGDPVKIAPGLLRRSTPRNDTNDTIDNRALTVGLVGLTYEQTPGISMPELVANLEFKNTLKAFQKNRQQISKADLKIALTHQGIDEDIKLAQKNSELTAVIGGHDHVEPEQYCRLVKKIPVCQTPANGKFLGRIDFEINEGRSRYLDSQLIPVSQNTKNHPKLAALLRPYQQQASKKYNQVIGYTKQDLNTGRGKETELGNLFADALRENTRADIALINSGGIRNSIYQGKIRLKDLTELYPFDNKAVVMNLKGEIIQEMLAHSVKQGGSTFLQVSGVEFTIKDNKPTAIKINNQPLEPKKIYKVAVDGYMAVGGNGYKMLTKIPDQKEGDLIRDIFIEYVRQNYAVSAPRPDRIHYFLP